MRIIYGWGWPALTDGKTCFLNENLKRYPIYHAHLVEHEFKHPANGFYSVADFWHDLKEFVDLRWVGWTFYFNVRHPESLIPIFVYGRPTLKGKDLDFLILASPFVIIPYALFIWILFNGGKL